MLNQIFYKKSRINSKLKILITLILILISYFNQTNIINSGEKLLEINFSNYLIQSDFRNNLNYSKFNLTEGISENISKDIQVKFCPKDNCFKLLNSSLNIANKTIECAFYELDDFNITKTLLTKSNQNINISLIIDDKYLKEKPLFILFNTSIKIYSDKNRGTRYNNYMHNKFCIIDNNFVLTGSTNPTKNGLFKNDNNMILIKSKYLSKNYHNEFIQMSKYNKYGSSKKSVLEYNNISLIYNYFDKKLNISKNKKYIISSYMCPEDHCVNHILGILSKAKQEVLFATFSFTNNDLEKKLLSLNKSGIKIEGIIESKNRNGISSIYKDVKGLDIKLDTNKNNMHNKFFIIDEKYVITGSMNPSKNGDKYNDENIIIIKNHNLALKYKNYYSSLINK